MNTRRVIANLAVGLQSVPYLWGGSSPAKGLDCSGFVLWIFQALELLPKEDTTAQGLYSMLNIRGSVKKWGDGTPHAGDLLFYGKSSITHVAIFLGDDLAISARGGNSDMDTREEALEKDAKVKLHKPAYRKDLVAWGSIEEWITPAINPVSVA